MAEPTVQEIRQAREELDQVIREIQRVPGFEDFLAAPSFDDVAAAAAREPLVYVTAADPGGLALIVTGDDVVDVPLDGLTPRALGEAVTAFRDALTAARTAQSSGGWTGRGAGAAAEAWETCLTSTCDWLYSTVAGPLLSRLPGLPPGRPAPVGIADGMAGYPTRGPTTGAPSSGDDASAGIALVTGGLLGLLPVHAARTPDATRPSGFRYLLDEVMVRYAPNARALTAARRLAAEVAVRDGRLLTVADPPRRDAAPLDRALLEVEAARRAFPGAPAPIAGAAATRDAVAAALPHVDVAHLACHGRADLDHPLDSRLLLAGQDDLRLRDLLAMQLRLRLAVLSACETLPPGTDLPDEVVSLPTGLLQAGTAGVVASLWAVPDRATAMLMTEFYRLWRHRGLAPAAALRAAQRWLRDSTNGDKAAHFRRALDAGQAWLPPDAEDLILLLEFQDEAGLGHATPSAWAGFAYIGA